MPIFLDAHTLIWSVDAPDRIPAMAFNALNQPTEMRLLSIGTIWEIAIKNSVGKLPLSLPFRDWIEAAIIDLSITVIPISLDAISQLVVMPHHHRDPFDRILAAESLVLDLPIASADAILDRYGVKRIWN